MIAFTVGASRLFFQMGICFLLAHVVHFIMLLRSGVGSVRGQIPSAACLPFDLHNSSSVAGSIRRGQINVYCAAFEKSNVVSILREKV